MKMMLNRVLIAVFALLLFSPLSGYAQERPRFAPDAEVRSAFDGVVEQVRASVVQVEVDGEPRILGTVVDADGYVLSKASELDGDQLEVVLPAGRRFEATLVGVDRGNDLAMLKIEADRLTAVSLSQGDSELGRMVACVGLTESPEAIGIVSARAREIEPSRLVLGVVLRAHPEGLQIERVNPGFGADKAGLQSGDVLTHVGDKKVIAVEQVVGALRSLHEGDEVLVSVLRRDEPMEVAVGLSEYGPDPRSRGERMNRMGSSLSERRRGFEQVVQHDAEIRPEHCGGPLVNLDGEVIGINIARAGRISSYALPGALIQEKLAALKDGSLAPVRVDKQVGE